MEWRSFPHFINDFGNVVLIGEGDRFVALDAGPSAVPGSPGALGFIRAIRAGMRPGSNRSLVLAVGLCADDQGGYCIW